MGKQNQPKKYSTKLTSPELCLLLLELIEEFELGAINAFECIQQIKEKVI